jgi:hypothetical protein
MSVINKIRNKQEPNQPTVSQESIEDFIKDGYEDYIHGWRGLQAIWQWGRGDRHKKLQELISAVENADIKPNGTIESKALEKLLVNGKVAGSVGQIATSIPALTKLVDDVWKGYLTGVLSIVKESPNILAGNGAWDFDKIIAALEKEQDKLDLPHYEKLCNGPKSSGHPATPLLVGNFQMLYYTKNRTESVHAKKLDLRSRVEIKFAQTKGFATTSKIKAPSKQELLLLLKNTLILVEHVGQEKPLRQLVIDSVPLGYAVFRKGFLYNAPGVAVYRKVVYSKANYDKINIIADFFRNLQIAPAETTNSTRAMVDDISKAVIKLVEDVL